MIWTDEIVAQLRTLWAEGYSASIIAEMLPGTNKNSVMGKVHRLRLPSRPTLVSSEPVRPPRPIIVKPVKQAKQVQPSVRGIVSNDVMEIYRGNYNPEVMHINRLLTASRSKARRPKPIVEVPMEHTPGYTLEQVQAISGCRFPLGSHKEKAVYWCGATQAEGRSYCQHHSQLCVQRPTGSLAAAVRLPERVR